MPSGHVSSHAMLLILPFFAVGVKVYVIDSASTANANEVLQHVKRVIRYVATESRTRRVINSSTIANGGGGGGRIEPRDVQ